MIIIRKLKISPFTSLEEKSIYRKLDLGIIREKLENLLITPVVWLLRLLEW
jgi:hypothetical protein